MTDSAPELLLCGVNLFKNARPFDRVVGVEQLEVECGQSKISRCRLLRNNERMVRKALSFDAPTSTLDYAKRIGDPALIAERCKIARIDGAEVAQELPFNRGRWNFAEKRIEQSLRSSHRGRWKFEYRLAAQNLCLDREVSSAPDTTHPGFACSHRLLR